MEKQKDILLLFLLKNFCQNNGIEEKYSPIKKKLEEEQLIEKDLEEKSIVLNKKTQIINCKVTKKNFKHNIDVVVDRLVIDNTIKSRLADSFELATTLTDGLAIIEILSNTHDFIIQSL